MSANKNTLARYDAIDNCLCDDSRDYFIEDLVQTSKFLLPEYLVLFSETDQYQHNLALYAPSVAQSKKVNNSVLMHIYIPLLPLDAQHKLIEKSRAIAKQLDNLRRQEDLLEEYRRSIVEQSLN